MRLTNFVEAHRARQDPICRWSRPSQLYDYCHSGAICARATPQWNARKGRHFWRTRPEAIYLAPTWGCENLTTTAGFIGVDLPPSHDCSPFSFAASFISAVAAASRHKTLVIATHAGDLAAHWRGFTMQSPPAGQ